MKQFLDTYIVIGQLFVGDWLSADDWQTDTNQIKSLQNPN